jgi:signal transduction histidine kinase
MFIAFLFLLIFSIILIAGNHHDETTRWSSFFSFVGGMGVLAIVLEYELLPGIVSKYGYLSLHTSVIRYGAYILSSTYYYLVPYIILWLGIINFHRISQTYLKIKRLLIYLLLVPCIAMLPFFGLTPAKSPRFWIVALWAVPYICVGIFLLISSYMTEHNMKVRRDKLINCIILVPIALVILFTNYILIAAGITDAWKYNSWLILFAVMALTFFLINYSALGVKLRIEKNHLENVMGAMSSGIAMLNHAIKNEIAKLAVCSHNARVLVDKMTEQELAGQIGENINIISNASEHLLTLTMKIQDSMREIILTEVPVRLTEVVDETLALMEIYFTTKKIKLVKKYLKDFEILFDKTYLLELLKNVIINAVEAMSENGLLQILIYQPNRYVILEIQDNGSGIPTDKLTQVIEPFYTTKKNRMNFGLGLSYCYNVMQKHGGSLGISSSPGKGTSVYLNFNPKKVIRQVTMSNDGEQGSEKIGSDSHHAG